MKKQRIGTVLLNGARITAAIFASMVAATALAQTYTYLGKFGTFGSTNGQLTQPAGLSIDPATRNIVVADSGNSRVEIFDSSGNFVSKFGGVTGCGTGQMFQTYWTAVDPTTHNIIVSSGVCGRMMIFSSTGAFVGQFGTAGSGNGQFGQPSGIAIDPTSHNIVVADSQNNHVQIFSSAGLFISQVGTPNSGTTAGTGAGQFSSPRGVAIDPFTHNIVVADSGNKRVQIFDSAGTYLSQFGSSGNGNGQFNAPYGVAIDPVNASIIVSDYGVGRMQVFTSAGLYISQFGVFGSLNGQFENAYGIAIDPTSRNVVIADQTNNRVQVFALTGGGQPQCTYALSSASDSTVAAAGAGSVVVNSVNGCAWTAVSHDTWIHITGGASGTGTGTVSYTVDANTGAQRTGTLSIAGLTYTLIQAPGTGSSAPLGFVGNVSYSISGDNVTVLVDRIANNRPTTTGTLRVELWALTASYAGSGGSGQRIAQTGFLAPLAGNTSYTNISQTLQITAPPAGTWYLVLFVTEYTAAASNDGFSIVDYHNFSTLYIVSASAAVIEFYNTLLDNYFITANAIEAAAIDSGSAGPGWGRTGTTFGSAGNVQVCRFYGSISPGPNSHFYTASAAECASLKQLQATTPSTQKRWNFESLDFQTTALVNGACPAGTVPVYRAYNNGFTRGIDSNHRITTSAAGIQQVVSRGWSNEGVVMCAPQ